MKSIALLRADLLAALLLIGTVSALAGDLPLSPDHERTLKPQDAFRECDSCPEMVVVPAGAYTMGSPKNEKGRDDNEGPQHKVTIAKPFAIGKFEVTVDQFAAFVTESGRDMGSVCDV